MGLKPIEDDEKELPPKYAEAIYSVENTAVHSDINIRPPMMSGEPPNSGNIGQPTIVLQQPVFVRPLLFGHKSQAMICPNCGANIVSQTKHETGIANWLVAGGICLVGGWCGCCLIPFCIDGLKDVEHYCPNCRAMMGRYRRV